jgi:hypothetical protein
LAQSPNVPRTLNSIQVLVRFAVRALLLLGFAAFGNIGLGRSLVALLWMAIVLCTVLALIRREPLFGAVLNHWDEAVAFGAMVALVSAWIAA